MTPREKDDWLVAGLIIGVIVVCVILALITQASCAVDRETVRRLNCLEACTKFAGQQGADVVTGWPLSGPECGCRMSTGEVRVTEGLIP